MKRKMALLEQAHGLLCNAPSDNTSVEDGDTWRKLRAEWITRWEHVIKDQQAKEHNRRIAIGNEAINVRLASVPAEVADIDLAAARWTSGGDR